MRVARHSTVETFADSSQPALDSQADLRITEHSFVKVLQSPLSLSTAPLASRSCCIVHAAMNGAAARLQVLSRQLQPQATSAKGGLDVVAFQRLLEHDNWETRQRMKDLMQTPLFEP